MIENNQLKTVAFSFVLMLSVISFQAYSQIALNNQAVEISQLADENKKVERSKFNVSMNLEAGFQTGSLSKKGTYYERINPQINYELSKNFTGFAGVQQTWIQNLNQLSINSEGNWKVNEINANYIIFYAGGSYQINPNLRLSGMAWKQADQQTIIQRKNNTSDFNARGFQLYMNYRITNNLQINASFNYQNGNSGNFFYNEFQQPYNPFGVSPYNIGDGFGTNPFRF
ncbi:MAG: hypothetical protein PHG67_08135 [Bacteroidales bacterium]|jgi:hypothetical protein|nr:hypothetical protein [Bacteroidales bacterium]HOI32756.1 hypothetical protein [Bacteroidales bacterium]